MIDYVGARAVSALDFGARETVGTSAEGDGRDESEDGSRPGEVSSFFPEFFVLLRRRRLFQERGVVVGVGVVGVVCCCCLIIVIVILQDFRPSCYSSSNPCVLSATSRPPYLS